MNNYACDAGLYEGAVVYGGKDQGTSKNMVSISPHLYRIYAVMKFEYGLLFMTWHDRCHKCHVKVQNAFWHEHCVSISRQMFFVKCLKIYLN